jgi:hypothetical protein
VLWISGKDVEKMARNAKNPNWSFMHFGLVACLHKKAKSHHG